MRSEDYSRASGAFVASRNPAIHARLAGGTDSRLPEGAPEGIVVLYADIKAFYIFPAEFIVRALAGGRAILFLFRKNILQNKRDKILFCCRLIEQAGYNEDFAWILINLHEEIF
jgi:hypothetical protein